MLDSFFRIKIITCNIHSGKNLWHFPQLENIIRFLQIANSDIIAIQEIHENTKKGLQVSTVSKKLKMNFHFGPHLTSKEGKYGIATYTKNPILERKHILLPSQGEQRGFLDTVIKINNKIVHIINTHLGLDPYIRLTQLKQLQNYLKNIQGSFIFMGDLNTSHTFLDEIDTAKVMKKEHEPTLMNSNRRIDYIYVSKDIKVHNYELSSVRLSDHYPVIVELSFKS